MENYVLKNIHVFSKEQACFLFDSDLLNVYEIDRETKEAIEMFQQQKGELPLEIYNDLLENGILISENDYCREREENINLINKLASQENSFNKIVLGVSNLCNMNCQYCYGSGGDYGLERELMSRGIAKRSIDYLLDNSGDYSTLHICFFGGEPLCNFDIVKYVVDYCKSIPLLREIKKRSTSKYVVGNGSKNITVRSYQRSFELLLQKQKIPHHGFHALRHTFATRAIECGMDVKSLSEILGHKNPTITLKRYVHSFMEHKREFMNRLGKLL